MVRHRGRVCAACARFHGFRLSAHHTRTRALGSRRRAHGLRMRAYGSRRRAHDCKLVRMMEHIVQRWCAVFARPPRPAPQRVPVNAIFGREQRCHGLAMHRRIRPPPLPPRMATRSRRHGPRRSCAAPPANPFAPGHEGPGHTGREARSAAHHVPSRMSSMQVSQPTARWLGTVRARRATAPSAGGGGC